MAIVRPTAKENPAQVAAMGRLNKQNAQRDRVGVDPYGINQRAPARDLPVPRPAPDAAPSTDTATKTSTKTGGT